MGLSLLLLLAAPLIGDPAPVLESVRPGEITIVEFFATWCEPCHRSLDDMEQIAKDLSFRWVIVAVDEPKKVRAFFAKRRVPATVVLNAKAGKSWGLTRMPTTFFVDRQWTIRHINRGHGSGFRARALGWLREMLK